MVKTAEQPKKVRGLKLHKNKILETEVVKWIVLEDISTYEIVKRLDERHNYRISPQSIESWKQNYLEELRKDIKDYSLFATDVSLDKVNILVELNRLAAIIDEKVVTLTSVALKKSTVVEGIVTYVNPDSEKLLKEYIELAIATREKILKYSPDFNIGDVIRDVIKQVAAISFLLFNDEVDKAKYNLFKAELVDAEKRLREQYLLKELK